MKCIKHIGIYVSDIDKMTEFYQNVFSMTIILEKYRDKGQWLSELTNQNVTSILITKLVTEYGSYMGTGDMLELIEVFPKRNEAIKLPIFISGVAHIAFGVNDIAKTKELIEENGGTIVVLPYLRDNGRSLMFARDIEGNWLEVIQ